MPKIKTLKDVAKAICKLTQPVSVGDIEKVLAEFCKLRSPIKRCPFCGERPTVDGEFVKCLSIGCPMRQRYATVENWNQRQKTGPGRPAKN